MFMSAPSLIAKAAIDLFSTGEIYNDLYISVRTFRGYLLSAVVAYPFWHHGRLVQKNELHFDPHQRDERDSSVHCSLVTSGWESEFSRRLALFSRAVFRY